MKKKKNVVCNVLCETEGYESGRQAEGELRAAGKRKVELKVKLEELESP